MAKRDCINTMEMGILAAALKETGDWEKAKAALPAVDPVVLDKGFKDWAYKAAGVKPPEPKKPEDAKKPDPLK